ncbi:MAG TPA: hypothetical protein VMU69_13980 [Bradyrhizobium sp.]|nr:hypothetical protein [Bradyrhizobium sp.]
MHIKDVRIVATETIAEQKRSHNDDIDATVLKTIATVLASFGINQDDRQELRADFSYLRSRRKAVEQVKNYTLRVVITVIMTGILGAMWLGIKTILGK